MKSLAYTGSRKRSLMPLFVPEKALHRSWSFTPFLKKQKNTKILRSHSIIVQVLNALLLIHSNVPDGKFCRSEEFESRIQSCVIHIISVCTTGYTSYSTSTGPHRLIVKNPNYIVNWDVNYSQWTWPESGKTLQRTSFKDELRIHLKRWGTSYNCPVLFSTCSLQHVLFCSHQLSPSAVYSSWRQNRITVSKPIQKVYFVSS